MKGIWYIAFLLILASCKGKEATVADDKPQTKDKETVLKMTFISAAAEEASGNYGRALGLYEKCLSMDDKNPAVHYEISRLHKMMSNLTEAITHAEQAVELGGATNHWYHLNLAELMHYASRFNDAATSYAKVVEHDERPEYLIAYGESLVRAGDLEGAISVFERLEQKMGSSPELVEQKYRLHMALGKKKDALAVLEKAVAENPNDLRYRGMLAAAYEEHGDLDRSIAAFEEMLEIDPNNGQVHLALFDYYWFKKEKPKAYGHLVKAFSAEDLEIDTKMGVLLELYDATEEDREDMDTVYELLDSLESTHPSEAKAVSIYGDFLLRDDREEEARDKFAKALELDAEKYVIWNQVMYLDLELNDFTSLLEHSSKALEYFPNQPGVYYFNGLALFKKKKYEESIDILEAGIILVIENDQLLKEFYQTLGDCYYKFGQNDNAFDAYDKALEIFPDNMYILNNYAYYLALDNLDLAKAATMAQKALDLAPTQASYLDTYAWIKFKQQDYKMSQQLIEKALEHGGEKNPVILEHYGDVLFFLDRIPEAVEYWEKAKEKGSNSETIEDKINQRKFIE